MSDALLARIDAEVSYWDACIDNEIKYTLAILRDCRAVLAERIPREPDEVHKAVAALYTVSGSAEFDQALRKVLAMAKDMAAAVQGIPRESPASPDWPKANPSGAMRDAEMERNAKRYEWLRDPQNADISGYAASLWGENMDAAIDRAIAGDSHG